MGAKETGTVKEGNLEMGRKKQLTGIEFENRLVAWVLAFGVADKEAVEKIAEEAGYSAESISNFGPTRLEELNLRVVRHRILYGLREQNFFILDPDRRIEEITKTRPGIDEIVRKYLEVDSKDSVAKAEVELGIIGQTLRRVGSSQAEKMATQERERKRYIESLQGSGKVERRG